MTKKLNIEELFKSKLEDLEQSPSADVWMKTSRALRRKQFLRFNPRRLNIYYSVGILLIGAGLAYALLNNPQQVQEQARETLFNEDSADEARLRKATEDEANTQEVSEAPAPQPVSEAQSEQTNKNQPTPSEITAASSTETKDSNENPQTAASAKVGTPHADTNKPISEPVTQKAAPEPIHTLIAYFTPSATAGCPPLEVTFVNNSVNALNTYWIIDGVKQNAETATKDLQHTFYESGTHTITLMATNDQGFERSHTETITVHPAPTAEFEIVDNEVYNYSLNATDFKWYIVTNEDQRHSELASETFSEDFQPLLEATLRLTPNAQSLVLIAKNIQGCSDTSIVALPEATQPELNFPTAFSPNPGGSTGGYYNPAEPSNRVFHPTFTEEPTTYNLKIFNATGEIIFETDNIYIGWDGYYKEAPAAQGVYIYQATGTWQSGEPFNYRGDITILWNSN